MKVLWCWRCKMDIPMLDDQEWETLWRAYHAASTGPRDGRPTALAEYERLTGYKETNFNALFDHRISAHGPSCPRCGKVLRTPVAYKCFECGFLVHDPNWSYLFCLEADAISIEGRGIVVVANEQEISGRLSPGSEIEFREGTRAVCRATVLSTGVIHDPPKKRIVGLVIQTTVAPSEIKAGQIAWLTRAPTGS